MSAPGLDEFGVLTVSRSNNFDALRLLGALLVIAGHAFDLTGSHTHPTLLGYPIQSLGVLIFFTISGYLITASWSRTPRLLPFFTARSLRILPALAVVVLVCALVVGPAMTVLPAADYVGETRTWTYLGNVLFLLQHDLPGVFVRNPYPAVVNGSLWTLPVEFACYVAVPAACIWAVVSVRVIGLSLFAAAGLFVSSLSPSQIPVVHDARVAAVAEVCVFFAVGALLRTAYERWPGTFQVKVALPLGAAYTLVSVAAPGVAHWVAWAALPYVTLTVGLTSTPFVRRAARYGDLSYGLYLWAFPVQQVLLAVAGVQAMAVNLPLVTVLTAALAWASWHSVESPALRLKDRLHTRLTPDRQVTAPAGGGVRTP